jgi:hypothetical protein
MLWRNDAAVLTVALGLVALLVVVSLSVPRVLHPLNIAWMKLAALLNRVVSPVVMLVLFAIAIVPFGLVMQLRYDPLRKRRDSGQCTYWIDRRKSSQVQSMANQY